jgi:multiple sugar transport system permease protein
VTWDNYAVVFRRPILQWALNSVVVTLTVTLLSIVFGAMTGYALARLNWPGRKLFFIAILMSLMIPTEATIVPLFIGFLKIGLMDSYPALILPALASVFSVYLFRQTFLSLPPELEEAAIIDGAGRFRLFWSIALPLARPTIIAAAILIFTSEWNAFVWPLLITFTDEMKVLPLGMAVFAPAAGGRTQIEGFAPAMAAMTILSLPSLLVFLVLQRYFMQGVISTGLKG